MESIDCTLLNSTVRLIGRYLGFVRAEVQIYVSG